MSIVGQWQICARQVVFIVDMLQTDDCHDKTVIGRLLFVIEQVHAESSVLCIRGAVTDR